MAVKPRKATFVSKIVKDPKAPPRTVVLTGFVADAAEKGRTRLYLDQGLCHFRDIPDEAILHAEELPGDSPIRGSMVWVDADMWGEESAAFMPTPEFAPIPSPRCPTPDVVCRTEGCKTFVPGCLTADPACRTPFCPPLGGYLNPAVLRPPALPQTSGCAITPEHPTAPTACCPTPCPTLGGPLCPTSNWSPCPTDTGATPCCPTPHVGFLPTTRWPFCPPPIRETADLPCTPACPRPSEMICPVTPECPFGLEAYTPHWVGAIAGGHQLMNPAAAGLGMYGRGVGAFQPRMTYRYW